MFSNGGIGRVMTFYGITGAAITRPDRTNPWCTTQPCIPTELRLSFDTAPSVETRRTLSDEINAFHARTVPQNAKPFALLLRDDGDRLVAGLSGVLSWQWLFVAALWVGDTWQGRGIGRALLTQAEAHAVAAGCHSAWLDTFQARGFLALGYQQFGAPE